MFLSVAYIFCFGIYGSYKGFRLTNEFLLTLEGTAAEMGTHDEYVSSFSENGTGWGPSGEHLISDFKYAQSQLDAIDPKYAPSYCMEIGFFFFPFLLTLFGALVIKSDLGNNIMRIRIALFSNPFV